MSNSFKYCFNVLVYMDPVTIAIIGGVVGGVAGAALSPLFNSTFESLLKNYYYVS